MRLVHAVHEPAGSGPHPTVLALHGWGASALDLLGLAPHLAGGAFLVLCPQGPMEVTMGPGLRGYGWFPITMGAPPARGAFEAGYDALDGFLADAMQRYPIAPAKLAVLGFSQGGVMAYALALRQRQRFAAVAALSTWLVPGLLAPTDAVPDLGNLPVLLQHGANDPMIQVARGREAVEQLRRWKADVTYREYDMGHEISAASLRDLGQFLHAQLVSPIVRV
jgi:phospholipase/carboxylesterase